LSEHRPLSVNDAVEIRGTALRVVEVVYPPHPQTKRALYKVHDSRVGLFYALKVYELTGGNSEASVTREMVALNKTAAYPAHFAKVHAFELRESRACLLLDWMPGSPLTRVTSAPPRGASEVARRLRAFFELCRVVSLIHKMGLVHRDLKPDNVLVRNPNELEGVAVIDFGLSNERRGQDEGTRGYRAPEQDFDRGLNLGPAADVFALAQIAHELVTGELPYLETADNVDWTSSSMARITNDARLPGGLAAALLGGLRYRPEQRLRALDLGHAVARSIPSDRNARPSRS